MNNEPWYKNAVFYEVSVSSFKDGNGDGRGDLQGLSGKLDYLQNLGVDCIWLMPIYPSPLKDDGYDISDYYNVAKAFGDLDDLKFLVNNAHARGIRVIMDLVMNHTSDEHPWFNLRVLIEILLTAIIMFGVIPTRNMKTLVSFFLIPNHPTGLGMSRPANITGIDFTPANLT